MGAEIRRGRVRGTSRSQRRQPRFVPRVVSADSRAIVSQTTVVCRRRSGLSSVRKNLLRSGAHGGVLYLAGRAVPSELNDCRRRRSATEPSCAQPGVQVGCQDIDVKYRESCEARRARERME